MKAGKIHVYEAPKAYDLVQALAYGADGGDSAGPGDNDNEVGLPEVP